MTVAAALRGVLAPNASPMTLSGTCTYLVGRQRPALIDPGPDERSHLERLEQELDGARPVAILLTHSHPDHAAAAAKLSESTGAPVLMARGALPGLFPPVHADRWIGDGDAVETDGGTIHAVATPGHTPDHFAFHWRGEGAPDQGALFVGDLMMGEGDTALVARPEGDLEAYLASLERVRQLSPGVLLPTHGPPLRDPDAAVARYLRHRHERLAQVAAALEEGAARPADLVPRVYGAELDRRLASAAAGSIAAMLEYLARRGRVRHDRGVFSLAS